MFFLILQRNIPARPKIARPPMTPPTMPPIAPPEMPESPSSVAAGADVKEAAVVVGPTALVTGAIGEMSKLLWDADDGAAVVKVSDCRADKLMA